MIAWKRANLPICTAKMLDVLKQLREGYQADRPFMYLDDVHGRTIRSLIYRDWIVKSVDRKGLDRPRYKITGRGLKACAIYEVPPEEYDIRRSDGICPRCCERPRGVYSTGRRKAYCDDCTQLRNQRRYHFFGYQKKPGLCPTCNKLPKHITGSGSVRSYCLPCRRKQAKVYRKQKYAREFAMVQRGEVLLCYRCHERPRWLTGKTLQDYCEDCTRTYRIERRRA